MVEHHGIGFLKEKSKWIYLGSPTILITVIVVIPFIFLLSGILNLQSVPDIFSSSPSSVLARRAIFNSLEQGSLSAAFCFIVGFPLGIFLGRFTFRFRRFLNAIVLIPFFLPSITVVFSFTSAFGTSSIFYSLFHTGLFMTHGLTGIIAVNTFYNAPLVALFTMNAASNTDQSLIEASEILQAGKGRTFAHIWGKNALIAALGGSMLAFIYSFAGFAAPLIMGGPSRYTLDAWIYSLSRILDNNNLAVFLVIFEILILLIPVLIFILLNRKTDRKALTLRYKVSKKNFRDPFLLSGIFLTIAWIVFELYLFLSIFITAFGYGSSLGVSENFRKLFSNTATGSTGIWAGQALLNSLFYGTMVSFITVAVGLMWIYGVRRNNGRFRGFSEFPQYIPLLISAIIMAFVVTVFFVPLTPYPFLWILIVFVQSSIAIPVVLRIMDTGFNSIPQNMVDASLILKGRPFFDVEIPLSRYTFASALMFGFALSLGEFTATNFIATGNLMPLTVDMYVLDTVKMAGAAYAAAVLLLIISFISFMIIQKLGDRFIGVF